MEHHNNSVFHSSIKEKNSRKWREDFLESLRNGEGESYLKTFIESGEDINTWKHGYTVLSDTARYGSCDLVELLITNGANPNMENEDGTKPLHLAAEAGKQDVVKLLLRLGVPINSLDKARLTPLQHAGSGGHRELVMFLLEEGAVYDAILPKNNPKPEEDEGCGCCSVTQSIFPAFMNWEAKSKMMRTALWYATAKGWLEVVQFLDDRGVDLDATFTTMERETPLILAADHGQRDVSEFLIKWGANVNSMIRGMNQKVIHWAAYFGWPDIARLVLERGAEVNSVEYDEKTPIYFACRFPENLSEKSMDSRLQLIDMLLKNGAWVNFPNALGVAPLHKAYDTLSCSNAPKDFITKLITLLLKYGADCNAKHDEKSVLDRFVDRRDLELVRLGIEYGGYFDCSTKDHPPLADDDKQNMKLWSLVFINKFNNKDLYSLYEIGVQLDEILPPLEKMKIVPQSGTAQDIERSVSLEIAKKKKCDMLTFEPIILRMLCLKSILKYYDSIRPESPLIPEEYQHFF